MSYGYFSLPRSLTHDPLWMDLPLSTQHIFIVILDHACFKPRKFDDHGHIIELLPGQICISMRDLIKQCHKEIRKYEIERSFNQLKKCGFLRQEVRHKKSIITITHQDTYDLILKASETRNETNFGQTSDKLRTETKNDNKEKKDNTAKEAINRLENVEMLKTSKIVAFDDPGESVIFDSSFDSLLSYEKNQEEELFVSEAFLRLSKFCRDALFCISDKCLVTWLGKRDYEYIYEHLKILERSKKSPIGVKNDEAWMEIAMKRDYVQQNKTLKINKTFAIKFRNEKKWIELEILEAYAKTAYNEKHLEFLWTPETFERELRQSFENFENMQIAKK